MGTLSVALVQLDARGTDTAANLRLGLGACHTAGHLGADLVVFPELWQVGYSDCPAGPAGRRNWLGRAITLSDPWLQTFRDLARKTGIGIAITYLQRWRSAPRNAVTVIDRHGRDVLTYAKVHTCDWVFERWLTPGGSFGAADLDTRHGPVRVGAMICFDREFPEPARALMLDGAELIVTPNACPLTDDRVGQFRARAFENMLAVAMANYPRFGGRSCAFDGMAFNPADSSPRDHRAAEAGSGQEITLARIDLDALRAYRRREVLADAYRKPRAYARIADTTPPGRPFLRPRSRR